MHQTAEQFQPKEPESQNYQKMIAA